LTALAMVLEHLAVLTPKTTPLIIEVRVNETADRAGNRVIPYGPAAVIEDAFAAVEAGASIVHWHARDAAAMSMRAMQAAEVPGESQFGHRLDFQVGFRAADAHLFAQGNNQCLLMRSLSLGVRTASTWMSLESQSSNRFECGLSASTPSATYPASAPRS
jgi:hypothetical protein